MAVWKRSIARRLLLGFLGTVILAMGVVGVAMSYLVQHYIYQTERMELVRKAKRINLAIQDSSRVNDDLVNLLVFLDQTFDARIWLFDIHGRIVATSTRDEVFIGKSVAKSVVEKVRQGEPVISPLGIEGLNEPMLSVAVPWGKGNQIYGGIVLHAPVKGINDAVSRVRETMAWALALGVVAATLLASYLSWSIARPLKEMERMAAELRQGRYDRRLDVHRDDEVGDLARTFNELADRLEASERERKRLDRLRDELLANLSHELRTPLTSMQGFLEALQDGLVEDEEL
ncbi:MAG: cell wall metabolism sensor histidine kinase WalK, partial [Calditerricola sp.]|nr:cell wall metabolism sensor histidine kinase WalK [Calditerricola sp.]